MKLSNKQKEIIEQIKNKKEIFLYGGARSGKTTLILIQILKDAARFKGSRHLIVRNSFSNIKTSLIEE